MGSPAIGPNAGRPYAGTIGNVNLALFGGVPAKGTWMIRFINFGLFGSSSPVTVNSVSLTLTLKNAPA